MARDSRRDPLVIINLLILLAVAALLIAPLLGFGRVDVRWVAGLLAARLVVSVLRGRQDPRLRRPFGWVIDALLIVALLTLAN